MLSAVKVEDSWPQGPLEPTSCQLSKQPHSSSATSSPRNVKDIALAQVRMPSWGPAAQGEAWAHLLKSSRVGVSGPQQGSASPQGRGTWVSRAWTEASTWASFPRGGGGGGLVAKSCPTLVTPWTVARQAPLSMESSRQEYWRGLPFPCSGDLSYPGIENVSPLSPALDSLPLCHLVPVGG